MTIHDQIRDGKLQYDINREAGKISALSSVKIHKYEYLTGEDISPSNQQQIIEQARFTYSPLRKAFERQIKTNKDQGQKHVDALESLKPKEQTKPIEDKSNNQSKAEIIFDDLINKKNNNERITWQCWLKIKNLKIKIGKKTAEQREVINNLNKFYKSREGVINFFRDYIEMLSDAKYDAKQDKTKEKGLKVLTPK